MKISNGSSVAAAAIVASTASFAEISAKGIDPLQVHTVALADHTAVVYCVELVNDDCQVITTIGSNAGVVGNAVVYSDHDNDLNK